MMTRRCLSAKQGGIAVRHFRCQEMSNRNSNSNGGKQVNIRLSSILLLILLIGIRNENEILKDA